MTEIEDKKKALLEKSIVRVRRVLTEHDKYLCGNETATRALVIDVVLTALDWDIRDPTRGWLEHRVNGNKVDYVLLSPSGEPFSVVEAKSADSGPKETDRRQASGYATEIGARYAVLTNGGRWEAWEMVPKKPRKDNVFIESHLTTGEIPKIASALGKLHRDILKQ